MSPIKTQTLFGRPVVHQLGTIDGSARLEHLVSQVSLIFALVNHLFRRDHASGVERPQVVVEQLHAELAQLKATGQPLPDDLVRLEALLDKEFRARVAKS